MTQHPHAELSAYIDGALIPAAQAAVEGHLVTCALCRAHVTQLRATSSLLHSLPDPVPSRRLVPRLAGAPAWLAPLRTLMTLASGAAVFLFIASAVLTNITFLASSSGATALSAPEVARDTAANAVQPQGGAATSTPTVRAPAAAGSPNQAFSPFGANASPTPSGATVADDAQKRVDQATAAPSGPTGAAFAPQETGRLASSAPQPAQVLNPWLWLTLAIISGAIAIALHRRLHSSV
jgi:anti-sigma factor RsiW